jgi:serine/threonine protein kinase
VKPTTDILFILYIASAAIGRFGGSPASRTQLDHPNIVRLEEVYESQSEIYLVQELCLGGELFDRLDEQPDYHYTEAECARLVKQMLCAVRYLHSKGIIHRDLKLENFLFSGTAKDSELKMIDFGLSKHFRYGEVQHEAVGTCSLLTFFFVSCINVGKLTWPCVQGHHIRFRPR